MSDLLQIFTGNPLSTFLGKKIEAATRPELESEDWALNMEICDIINDNDDDAKDAARAIKKRLQQIEQDRNFTITNRTLTVLETCVNNCSHRFHILVMTKDFIQDLVKLIGPKNNPPIDLQERVLSLIETWAEAFRGQPDLSGVVSVYNDLKAKGVTFPARDPGSRVPIQTPQRTVPPSANQTMPRTDRQSRPTPAGAPVMMPAPNPVIAGQVMLEGEGYNKITQDLVVVQSSIEMFDDIMRALDTSAGAEADWKLADELSVTCRQMKDRIVDLIERIANEDLTIELLRLNDELNSTFTRYESLLKNRSQRTSNAQTGPAATSSSAVREPNAIVNPTPALSTNQSASKVSGDSASQQPKLIGVSSNTLNELSLIDFDAARAGDSMQTNAKITSKQAAKDPFDTSNIPLASSGGNKGQKSLADELGAFNLGNSKGESAKSEAKRSTVLPDEISTVREQDFAEIENWLATDSGRDLTSIGGDMPSMEPISVPNSEFDNFIASRALAGTNNSGQQQDQHKSKTSSEKQPEPSV